MAGYQFRPSGAAVQIPDGGFLFPSGKRGIREDGYNGIAVRTAIICFDLGQKSGPVLAFVHNADPPGRNSKFLYQILPDTLRPEARESFIIGGRSLG